MSGTRKDRPGLRKLIHKRLHYHWLQAHKAEQQLVVMHGNNRAGGGADLHADDFARASAQPFQAPAIFSRGDDRGPVRNELMVVTLFAHHQYGTPCFAELFPLAGKVGGGTRGVIELLRRFPEIAMNITEVS